MDYAFCHGSGLLLTLTVLEAPILDEAPIVLDMAVVVDCIDPLEVSGVLDAPTNIIEEDVASDEVIGTLIGTVSLGGVGFVGGMIVATP